MLICMKNKAPLRLKRGLVVKWLLALRRAQGNKRLRRLLTGLTDLRFFGGFAYYASEFLFGSYGGFFDVGGS